MQAVSGQVEAPRNCCRKAAQGGVFIRSALPRWKPRIVFSGHFMPNRYADVIGNQPTITFTLFPRDMDHFDSFFRSMKAALDALSETEIYFTQEEYDRIRKAADQ